MSKWKCKICARQMITDEKPSWRLCADCNVSLWKKVIDIKESIADAEGLAVAKTRLREAEEALNKSRQEVK